MKLISQQQIKELILTDFPEQTDYWLCGGKGKHTEIALAVKCANCGHEVSVTIKNRTELKAILKRECAGCLEKEAAANAHLDHVRFYFGRYRGKTVNEVMEADPAYLAWFVDCVKGRDPLIAEIKTHTRFRQAWAEYVEMQAARMPKERREEKEWQEGRFSQQTIDDLFNCFYGEE